MSLKSPELAFILSSTTACQVETITPRVIVLSPNPSGLGGIERVSRTFITVLADLYGADRVGLLRIWRDGSQLENCSLLFDGTTPRHGTARKVPLGTQF